MNIDRLNTLADTLDQQKFPEGFTFDMSTVLGKIDCGTAGCIAGLALVLFKGIKEVDPLASYSPRATRVLDLTEHEADLLFFPGLHVPVESNPFNSNPKEAAAAIRNLIATDGEQSWL